MRRFVVATASVAVISYAYYLHPEPPRSAGPELIDRLIAIGVPVTLFLAVLVMLRSRTTWTIRAVGLFYVALGSAFLMIAVGRSPRLERGQREFFTDLARSAFIVGAPALLFGVLTWFWFYFHHRAASDDVTGLDEVRDRRRWDRRKETRDLKARLNDLERGSNGS